jgi:hypothetical protein
MANNKVQSFVEDMEAGEMLMWLVIIGLAIYFVFFWNNGGLWGSFQTGWETLWNGVTGKGFATTAEAAGANLSNPVSAAQIWNQQYLQSRNPGANPFDPSVYTNNPGNSQMTNATAQSIASTVSSAGGGWFTSGDITSVVPAFQNNCQTQEDVSQVAGAFQASENTDLLTYMLQQFNNGGGATSDNAVQLQSLIQWCVALPS